MVYALWPFATWHPRPMSLPSVSSLANARGWLVVAACFLVAVYTWGFGFYAHGIYLVELRRSTGWTTAFVSLVITAYYIASAVLLPLVAKEMARIGPAAVFLIGLALTAAGLVTLPHVTEPWQLVVVYGVLAAGWAHASIAPIVATVGQWFDRRRGLALNLALSGATVSGLVIAPLLLALVERHGFARGLTGLALAATVIVATAVVAFVRRGPPPGPDHPDARAEGPISVTAAVVPAVETRQPLRTAQFWSIAGPFALCLWAQVGVFTHLVPMLTERVSSGGGGIVVDAGFALGLATAMALAGRIGFAVVVDRIPQRRLAALSFLNQVVAIAVLLVAREPWLVYVACALFGLSVGNNITIAPMIIQREYPAESFARLVALSTAATQITYALGPGMLGILRDLVGSYQGPLLACALADIVAAVWVWRRRGAAMGR